MEDLTNTGTTVPMLPGFSHKQICSLIDELAKVHATSWKNRSWIKSINMPYKNENEFFKIIIEMAHKLKEIKPEWFNSLIDEISPYFKSNYMQPYLSSETSFIESFGFRPCAVHGDLWAPNVLWLKDAENKATENVCAIIDWQMIHLGNPCEDIGRLLNINTTSEYRRANTKYLLQRYADKLFELFDGKSPITYEQILNAYDNAMLPTSMFTIFGAPMYYNMPAVVGTEPGFEQIKLKNELLMRVRTFLEDTLKVLKTKKC